jgi:hypothetical protein
MNIRWSKAGYTKEEVDRFKPALEALKEILETDYLKKEAVRDYSPGWEYKQIAVNEHNAVLESIIKLVSFNDDM